MMNLLALFFSVLLIAFVQPAEANEKLRLQLKWTHQFQFAGYYIAQEKGWYREAGLDVEIREALPDENVFIRLYAGDADYAIGSPIGLVHHQKDPLVALAAVYQNSPSALMVRRDSDIRNASDLRGKRIMLGAEGEIELQAMLHTAGIGANDYQRQNTQQDIRDLIEGRTDALSAYLGDEPAQMEALGEPYRILRPQDIGIDFYGDVLYTLPKELEQHPARARAFLEASLRGWRYAFEHMEETVNIILRDYNTQGLSKTILLQQAYAYRDLAQPQLVEVGYMSPQRWQRMGVQMQSLGILEPNWNLNGFLRDPRQMALTPGEWAKQHWIGLGIGGGVAALLLFALFNYRLKTTLELRTRALHAETRKLELSRQATFRTEQRRQADNIQNLKIQVESERQESENHRQFINMLTHEIKTPLGIALISSGALKSDSPYMIRLQRALNDINAVVERTRMSDLVEYQRLQPHFEPTAPRELLFECIESSVAPERLKVFAGETPEVRTDSGLLAIVINNLLDNALKYSPPESFVEVRLEAGADGVLLRVTNEVGPAGVPDADLLFSKYYRAPAAHSKSGSGLGLYLSRQLAELSGAQLQYCAKPGAVEFTLCLPA